MKTQAFAEMLRTLAPVLESSRAADVRALAAVFAAGADQTVAARLKTFARATGHPADLESVLLAVERSLLVAGAKSQAKTVAAVRDTMVGPGTAATSSFLAEITAPRQLTRSATRAKGGAAGRAVPTASGPDVARARQLADELTSHVLDAEAFGVVVARLRSRQVDTPTLYAVAERFLGSARTYRRRGDAITAIVARQKAEARERARGTALSRLGV